MVTRSNFAPLAGWSHAARSAIVLDQRYACALAGSGNAPSASGADEVFQCSIGPGPGPL